MQGGRQVAGRGLLSRTWVKIDTLILNSILFMFYSYKDFRDYWLSVLLILRFWT